MSLLAIRVPWPSWDMFFFFFSIANGIRSNFSIYSARPLTAGINRGNDEIEEQKY